MQIQIQRIQTLHDLQAQESNNFGASLLTKDYFEANPVFYYCYRIFPFERGHGIFVANSIRRFLLYEIPTIAITSVLIHSKNPAHFGGTRKNSDPDFDERTLENDFDQAQKVGAENFTESQISNQSGLSMSGIDSELTGQILYASPQSAQVHRPKLAKTVKAEMAKKPSQPKKKKVTKKALKEQAAELFSYNVDHLPVLTRENLETEEVSSMTEFTTIPFVRESFLEILLNLKACVFENISAFDPSPRERSSTVLKGKLILNASQEALNDPTESSQELFFQKDFSVTQGPNPHVVPSGRRVREYKIWAKDLILPPGLKVRNPNHVIATLVAPKTNCEFELSFEKIFQPDLTTLSMKTGRPPHRAEQKRRNVPIDGTLFPIKKVNFALSYTKFQKEVITFEIWTNGGLNPRDAIFQSVENIMALFQNLRHEQVKELEPFDQSSPDEFDLGESNEPDVSTSLAED